MSHAATVHYLNEVIVHAVEGGASVLVQNPVRLSEYSEPQPDLALLRRRDDFYRERHPRRWRPTAMSLPSSAARFVHWARVAD